MYVAIAILIIPAILIV